MNLGEKMESLANQSERVRRNASSLVSKAEALLTRLRALRLSNKYRFISDGDFN